ncbi:hypothetical protein J2X12_004148 [Pseudarthrobacter oxydans]|uniref:Uncharacterized protein n=1 Tax=Pseudarthrobacter oxydans TaxID=1671 RepID=A0AAW8NI20_PSEOX|nr:hypothetical protein [Pseudarthrobacter oxydans]MDR6794704.1 hypothetical protein [Pseudarthrobacter oxydans]MDR7166094.1 hypothetical protein [Pseudarthrobacter oxydans]
MTKALTREDAVALIIERAALLQPEQILQLVDELPVNIEDAIADFGATVGLSPSERRLLAWHNISIPWELMEYAKVKEFYGPNITVEWPPRNQ